MTELVRQIEQFSAKNFADHAITRRHENDVTRHYRCQKPGTWCYGFDVTFTPKHPLYLPKVAERIEFCG